MAGPRLETLLQAYAAERADDTQAVTSFITLLTTSIGLITLIGFALINHKTVPGWLIALAPLLPLPFAAFGALVTHVAQIRGRVIDAYESEIRVILNAIDRPATLIPYGHTVLNRAVWASAYARVVLSFAFLIFFGGYAVVTWQCFRYARETDSALAVVSLTASALATCVVIGLFGLALFPDYWLGKALAGLRRDM